MRMKQDSSLRVEIMTVTQSPTLPPSLPPSLTPSQPHTVHLLNAKVIRIKSYASFLLLSQIALVEYLEKEEEEELEEDEKEEERGEEEKKDCGRA